jgi:hypothetical protein
MAHEPEMMELTSLFDFPPHSIMMERDEYLPALFPPSMSHNLAS